MRSIYFLPLIFTLFSWVVLADEHPHELKAVAARATVAIAPVGPQQRSIALPAMRFSFALDYRCASPYDALSLSLAIADDHRYVTADELEPDGGSTTIEIAVEEEQIAPVAISGYCQLPETAAEEFEWPAPFTLSALLSAQASLRCGNESQQDIIYRMIPLDVTLSCAPEAPPETPAE